MGIYFLLNGEKKAWWFHSELDLVHSSMLRGSLIYGKPWPAFKNAQNFEIKPPAGTASLSSVLTLPSGRWPELMGSH